MEGSFSLDSLSPQTRLNWLLRLKRSRNLILMCVSLILPAWFSSWWGWSQSSSTPNAAPPHGQRWHVRCHKPQPAGCRLQTRPRWTRCLYWASPTRRTTGGEGGRERENNIVNGYRYLSTVLNNYLGGHLRNQKQWENKFREERWWESRVMYEWVRIHKCVCGHNVNSARKTGAQSVSHWAVMNCETLK